MRLRTLAGCVALLVTGSACLGDLVPTLEPGREYTLVVDGRVRNVTDSSALQGIVIELVEVINWSTPDQVVRSARSDSLGWYRLRSVVREGSTYSLGWSGFNGQCAFQAVSGALDALDHGGNRIADLWCTPAA